MIEQLLGIYFLGKCSPTRSCTGSSSGGSTGGHTLEFFDFLCGGGEPGNGKVHRRGIHGERVCYFSRGKE